MRTGLRLLGLGLGLVLTVAAGLSWAALALGPEVWALRWDKPWWLAGLALVPVVLWFATVE